MRLLLRPLPLPDEWLGSWLVRLAVANHLSLPRLLSLMRITTEHPPSQAVSEELAEAGAVTLATIDEMTVMPDQALTTIGSSRTTGSRPFLGVQFLQLCPVCLATDPVPHIRRAWLLNTAVACDLHGGPLLDRCPHCQRHLQVYRRRKPKRHAKLFLVLHHSVSDLKRCPVCRGALTTPPAPLRRLPPEQPHPDDGSLLKAEHWTRFVAALNLMIASFAVTELIDFSLQPPQAPEDDVAPEYTMEFPPGTASNRAKVEHRFQEVLLRRLVLTPLPGDSTLSSLRLFAGELLDRTEKSSYGHSVRWNYLSWLAYTLQNSTPDALMLCWPGLVAFVVGLRDGRDDLRPTFEIPEFRLTDEQWAMADLDLARGTDTYGFGSQRDRRNAFEAYLELLLMSRAWGKVPVAYAPGQAHRWRLEELIESWTQRKCMHAPLERLYDQLLTHLEDRTSRWVLETEALFVSDGMINFLIRERLPSALDLLQGLGLSMQEHLDQRSVSEKI